MSIGTWIDTRIQNAWDGIEPKLLKGIGTLLDDQTTKLFAKFDAQLQAISALAVADAKQITDEVGNEVKSVADTVSGDITGVSGSILEQLKSFIPGL